MTITLTGAGGLFTILKQALTACETATSYHGTIVPTLVENVISEMADADTIDAAALISPLASAATSIRGNATLPAACQSFAQALVINRVTADAPHIQASLGPCLDELDRQMSATVERNVVAATVTAPHTTAPTLLVSTTGATGRALEACVDETLVGTATSTTRLALVSGAAQRNALSPDWPTGSGLNKTLTVQTAGVLRNHSFDEETVLANAPDDWIVEVGVVGTTIALTNSEIQSITVGGPAPTSGTWTISHTSSASVKQTTTPLAYNAGAADVQAALAAFVGFADVSVSLTGAVYTVNFNGVTPAGDQALLTTANTFDSGTLTVAEVVGGASAYEYKSLAILGTAAAELTTLRQRAHALNLTPNGVYAVSVQAKKIAATTGTLYLELVDGTNTVLPDDLGTANRLTLDISTFSDSAFGPQTGFFRLPKVLPDVYYLQLRTTDLADTKGFYLDDLLLVPATQLYTDGPYAALLANGRLLASTDRYTVAVTNTWAGRIQTWWYRWFGRLLLSATLGAETISDP